MSHVRTVVSPLHGTSHIPGHFDETHVDTPSPLSTVDIKMRAFRNRWLGGPSLPEPFEDLAQPCARPQAILAPRMVFRESEADPAFFRSGKSRVSVTSTLRLLKVGTLVAVAIVLVGTGLERLFAYAPDYLQTYVVTEDAAP